MRQLFVASIICALSAVPSGHAQAQTWQGLTAGAVADQVLGEINNSISKAMEQGDYLMARAGVQAKDAIDAWKVANTELLDKAFTELKDTQRDMFLRANALVTKTNNNIKERMETAQQIMESATAITENIPVVGKGRTFATRYGPRIIPGGEEVILTIRGVNFDEADPKLSFDGKPATRTSLTQNEVQFLVPHESSSNSGKKLIRTNLKFTYTVPAAAWYSRWIGGKNLVERELSLIVLPEKFATYSYVAKSRTTVKETAPHTADLGQFKGRNRRIYKVANPPTGYKWDLSQPYSSQQGQGEAGRCEGFDTNATTENGISFFARVDEIRDSSNFGGLVKKDGYVSCSVSGTVYRMVDKDVEHPAQEGVLDWSSDIPIKKPANTIAQTLTVKLFNGEVDVVVGQAQGKFFETIDARDTLIISPELPPADTK